MEALEGLVVGNADFEEVERLQDVFCPFEAIGMVRQEIRHAHYLAHCLDPQRPHGFGAECLRALMRSAAAAQRVAHSQEGLVSPGHRAATRGARPSPAGGRRAPRAGDSQRRRWRFW